MNKWMTMKLIRGLHIEDGLTREIPKALLSQPVFIYSRSLIETAEQFVKFVQI